MIDLIYKLSDLHEALRREKRFKEADTLRQQVKFEFNIELRTYKNGWTIPFFPEFPEKLISLHEEAWALSDNF